LKKPRPLMAIIWTVILGAPVVHAQTPANFQTPSTSIFTVVPTTNGHPKPYQNDLHSLSASSPADIWAVGQTGIHFDGTSPANSNTRVDILFGGTVIPQGNLWLVGNEFGRTLVLNAPGQ